MVASFYPFAYVAQRVGGEDVLVENLTGAGIEPHDIELRPRQIGDVQDADLVIYQKDFQAAVDDAVDQAARPRAGTLDVATVVQRRPSTAEDATGGYDPHVWLDPATMVAVTEAVKARLSAVDPAHASTYRTNAAALVAELRSLDRAFTTGLARCRIRDIVTSHAAFGYLAEAYGLRQVAIAGIDPSSEPSARQLADIAALVRRDRVTTVFTEELVSPKVADTVARETGASTATLSPIEGLTEQTKDETYLTLMRANLAALRKANACT